MRTRQGWMLAAIALGLVIGLGPDDVEAAKRAKTKVELSGVVNLNEASASQLDLLPGVGEKAAERIIQYRKKRPFKRTGELVRVKGFGKKKFAKLKDHLSVTGPTTLTANRVRADAPPPAAQAQAGPEPQPQPQPQPQAQAQARARPGGRR